MMYSGSLASDDLHEIPFQPVLSQMPYLESLTSEHLFGILRHYFRPECSLIGDEVLTPFHSKKPVFFLYLTPLTPLFSKVIHV